MEIEENESKQSAIIALWEQILVESATNGALFFKSARETIDLITSKFHLMFVMYLLFLSTFFVCLCFYVFMTLAITFGISYKVMMYIISCSL